MSSSGHSSPASAALAEGGGSSEPRGATPPKVLVLGSSSLTGSCRPSWPPGQPPLQRPSARSGCCPPGPPLGRSPQSPPGREKGWSVPCQHPSWGGEGETACLGHSSVLPQPHFILHTPVLPQPHVQPSMSDCAPPLPQPHFSHPSRHGPAPSELSTPRLWECCSQAGQEIVFC